MPKGPKGPNATGATTELGRTNVPPSRFIGSPSRRPAHYSTVEVRPDVSTALAARLTDEPRFDVGQPDIIRPLIANVGADPGRMAALIIRAIDQDAANAG